MPTILLIRHGENEYVKKGRLAGRLPGVQLNEKGQQQAQALAENLKDAPIKSVYASPLERTLETAAPIAAALNLDVIPNSGLLEIDFGDWQDKTLKELRRRKLWHTVQQTPSRMCFPNGESFAAAQARIIAALEALCQKHSPEEMLICVSHSDSIKLAVAYYLGMPIDHFQRLTIAPASITTLFLGEKQARVIHVNSEKWAVES
ncbi:MAG: MSMEG_4193 family putative phosphomutase [Anaerolineae bacterium]|nr:MSMEG_4193 family putative phosphomutase [Anaerolineae bacterium]MBL6966590.1 MSMEG_4193 family putative phosphomutase [Anaerolineales bacterium]